MWQCQSDSAQFCGTLGLTVSCDRNEWGHPKHYGHASALICSCESVAKVSTDVVDTIVDMGWKSAQMCQDMEMRQIVLCLHC